jgi:importin subunit beta-1
MRFSFNLVRQRLSQLDSQSVVRVKMDVNAVLAATLSPAQHEREAATAQLQSLLASNPSAYLVSLSHALAAESTPSHIRNAAGLAIKNALTAREAARQEEYASRWKGLDPATREQLKQEALATLAASDRGARNVSGQVVAAIAAVELPAGMWSGLIGQLLELASRADNAHLRQATLQTIGYICEGIVSRAAPPDVYLGVHPR